MPCACAIGGGGGSPSSTGSSSYDTNDTGYVDQSLIPSRFCFKCATFWVIIAVIFLFVMAGSRR
jgi:hypothetical protein